MSRRWRQASLVAAMCGMFGTGGALADTSPVTALINARLVVRPGEVVERGTLLVQGTRIVASGASVKIPREALTVDLAGKTVFAGFIDLQTDYAQLPPSGDGLPPKGARELAGLVHAATDVAGQLRPDPERAALFRSLGFTSVLSQPTSGIFRGQAALLSTMDSQRWDDVTVASAVAQSIAFETYPQSKEFEGWGYPMSIRGAIAGVRQTLIDAQWQRERLQWQQRRHGERIEANASLTALLPVLDGKQPVIFEAPHELDFGRVATLAKEFQLNAVASGNGSEYRHLNLLQRNHTKVIVPLTWPAAPEIGDDDAALDVPLVDMEKWEWAPFNPRVLAEAKVPFALTANGLQKPASEFWPRVREAVVRGLDEDTALDALTVQPAKMLGVSDRLGTLQAGQLAMFVIADADLFRSEAARIHEVWVNGLRHQLLFDAPARPISVAVTSKPALPGPIRFPFGEYGPTRLPDQPAAVVVRNATIWTQGPQDIVKQADLLVRAGRIVAVGSALKAPAGAVEIDATGMHVTPGLIDTHSHSGVDLGGRPGRGTSARAGSVWSENLHQVTPEVRVSDVLIPNQLGFYYLLSSGLTTMLVLPGSGQLMVGQAQTVKLRWGAEVDELPFAGAPCGMKSAIGENATLYSWGEGKRYPYTRMGQMDILREAFDAARAYDTERKVKGGPPQRRDLRMEALLEILAGRCIMHVHNMRQDDISSFLAMARENKFVPIIHHAAEAYKVADEFAAMGAGVAIGLDWWGFRLEMADGMPQAAALLTRQGVNVSMHSDIVGDGVEWARRFNADAGMTVKYGGMNEVQALNMATLNSARQLGVGDRIGSLEPGKDADFVLWDRYPLSTSAVAQQTWIDGRRYFERNESLREAARLEREHQRLVSLARRCGVGKPYAMQACIGEAR